LFFIFAAAPTFSRQILKESRDKYEYLKEHGMRRELHQTKKSRAIFACAPWLGLAALLLAIFAGARFVHAQSTPVTLGYRDFYFGATVTAEPTSEKPQSKLWWNDGLWWGSLWNPAANRYEIYRFEVAAQSWTTTGIGIDTRPSSRADALWDGEHLYVVSQVYATTAALTTAANSARLYRYSYAAPPGGAKSYSLDAGFPVNVNGSKSETLVLDKDSTGKLWITWVENGKVMLNRTMGDDLTWGTPFILPVQGNDTDPDDISTLVAFGGNQIGVMWSNQKDSTTYFAAHRDGDAEEVWQPRETALSDPAWGAVAEDHLNLKAACDASGNLYAATMTNLSGTTKPGIFVLKRSPAFGGTWTRHVFAMAHLDHSRPALVINHENQRLYVFTRSNETGPSMVYMKSASLNDLEFPGGLGTPFIHSDTDINVTNPAVAKQCATNGSGIVVLAADRINRNYLHNYVDFAASAPKIISFAPASGPAGTAVTITGSNFTTANKVSFNGVAAAGFTVDSDTQLRVTLPAGATTGAITVVNAIDAGSSTTPFTVKAPPKIASFTPADGPAGTEVKIIGSNFLGATGVAFNGKPAVIFTVDSDAQLRAKVPAGAATGKISVTNPDGAGASANVFTVTSGPLIASFVPAKAQVGAEITISGSNFTGVTKVAFNGITASSFVVDSSTKLRVPPGGIPAGATTGPISVTNSAGTGNSAANFVVQHLLTLTFSGSGSVDLNPPGSVYDQGAVATLTTVPASGWEFSDWGGDLQGTMNTATLTMNTDKRVTAKFKAIPKYAVTLNLVGTGGVTLDPPGGVYYRDTVVKLTAAPGAGYVFSGYGGDFKGWMNVETLAINANKNITATFSPLPAPRYPSGIWTSAAEVSQLPAAGLVWDNLKARADKPMGPPNLSDKEDSVNVAILAKALVYARTGNESYRQAVIAACMAAIGTEQNGETLDLGRELMAYVLAADLVGLPPAEKTTFQSWLRNVLAANLQGQTLRSSHETRPNNWGTHCGATRAAIVRYLGDATELERAARLFKGWLGDRNTYADFSYGALDWQADITAPVGVNPLGAMLNGHSVDGVLPDDQRRAGGFVWPPPKENYVYEALQGALAQAIILHRAGYDVWNWQDQALLRSFKWLYNQAAFPVDGDDEWLPHIINHYYKMNFPAPVPSAPGKNAGWTDWLYGSAYALTVSANNGDVEIHSLGAAQNNLAAMQLAALPDPGYLFTGWSGNLSGAKNPDTLVMNASKSVTANFVKAGPFTVTVTLAGSGTVALDPPGGVYYGGTAVTLTATANPGFKFMGWSGGLTGSTNPAQLTITANKNITATFKAIYTLAVTTTGSGTVALNPPGSTHEVGAVVTLAASPAPGHQFVEWSGDLIGSANPASITMNANKQVTATFAVIKVTHEETRTGGASSSTTVTTATSLAGISGQLYLAAISTRPFMKANAVSGLGLNWRLLRSQCAGRNNTGVEVWMAQGTPSDGTVSATFVSAPTNAVIAVSRYSGVPALRDGVNPVGNVFSGNTKGANGICSGGVDNSSYSFNLTTSVDGAVIYGAAAMRNRTHTPGAGYAERAEIKQGASSITASLAVEDKVFPSATLATCNGIFSGSVDWAVVAVEIKPPTGTLMSGDSSNNGTKTGSSALSGFQLHNYPNPFNAQTTIEYNVPPPGGVHVSLAIYNLTGQKVRTLIDELQPAGRQKAHWNGKDDRNRDAGSGVYLIHLEAGAQRLTRRIILLK
jgi:hypothetical protein